MSLFLSGTEVSLTPLGSQAIGKPDSSSASFTNSSRGAGNSIGADGKGIEFTGTHSGKPWGEGRRADVALAVALDSETVAVAFFKGETRRCGWCLGCFPDCKWIGDRITFVDIFNATFCEQCADFLECK